MTSVWKSKIARRPLLAAIAGAIGLGVVGAAVYELPHLFRRRYPPTPYDDLINLLPDRENARVLGAHVSKSVFVSSVGADIRGFRRHYGQKTLPDIVQLDLEEGRVVSVAGWVLPTGLAILCDFAYRATPPG